MPSKSSKHSNLISCQLIARYHKIQHKVITNGYIAAESTWVKKRQYYPNFGKYKIPKLVTMALMQDNCAMLGLHEELSPENYTKHSSTLLFIEQEYMNGQMMRYELPNARLFKAQSIKHYRLNVPGLEEGRPSIIAGDKLWLRSKKNKNIGPVKPIQAYVVEIHRNDIILRVNNTEVPVELISELCFKVNFIHGATPYQRCHHAIRQFNKGFLTKDCLFPDKRSLTKLNKPPLLDICGEFMPCQMLNEYQQDAVINILRSVCRPMPYIIFGPPGTGKTSTLVEAIIQIYKRNMKAKILACSNANTTADMIMFKLIEIGVVPLEAMIRIVAEYRLMAESRHENLGTSRSVPPIPEEIFTSCCTMDMIEDHDWESLKVIVATCQMAGALRRFGSELFDYVLIDEAGRANEPESLIALSLLKPTGVPVIAGDQHQLGPVVFAPMACKIGLACSLFERITKRVATRNEDGSLPKLDSRFITMLKECYRNDPRIMEISNKNFYRGELIFRTHTPSKWLAKMKFKHPIVFVETKGKEERHEQSPSIFNLKEAVACMDHICRLTEKGVQMSQIGFVTPYREQIVQMSKLFKQKNIEPCLLGTMEEFQGREKKVIVISTVRTNKLTGMTRSFLNEPERFNVAISRAKWLVILVGDPDVLALSPLWAEYMSKCKEKDSYLTLEYQQQHEALEALRREELSMQQPARKPKWRKWPKRNKRKPKAPGHEQMLVEQFEKAVNIQG